MAAKNGQHASGSAEWWTPPEIVEPARLLFGGFDLDVASCLDANRIVQARSFYSAHDDGILDGDKRREWNADVVWCNPPSRRLRVVSRSLLGSMSSLRPHAQSRHVCMLVNPSSSRHLGEPTPSDVGRRPPNADRVQPRLDQFDATRRNASGSGRTQNAWRAACFLPAMTANATSRNHVYSRYFRGV